MRKKERIVSVTFMQTIEFKICSHPDVPRIRRRNVHPDSSHLCPAFISDFFLFALLTKRKMGNTFEVPITHLSLLRCSGSYNDQHLLAGAARLQNKRKTMEDYLMMKKLDEKTYLFVSLMVIPEINIQISFGTCG